MSRMSALVQNEFQTWWQRGYIGLSETDNPLLIRLVTKFIYMTKSYNKKGLAYNNWMYLEINISIIRLISLVQVTNMKLYIPILFS